MIKEQSKGLALQGRRQKSGFRMRADAKPQGSCLRKRRVERSSVLAEIVHSLLKNWICPFKAKFREVPIVMRSTPSKPWHIASQITPKSFDNVSNTIMNKSYRKRIETYLISLTIWYLQEPFQVCFQAYHSINSHFLFI